MVQACTFAVATARALRYEAESRLREPICRDDFGPDAMPWAEYEAAKQFPCGWDERDAKV